MVRVRGRAVFHNPWWPISCFPTQGICDLARPFLGPDKHLETASTLKTTLSALPSRKLDRRQGGPFEIRADPMSRLSTRTASSFRPTSTSTQSVTSSSKSRQLRSPIPGRLFPTTPGGDGVRGEEGPGCKDEVLHAPVPHQVDRPQHSRRARCQGPQWAPNN